MGKGTQDQAVVEAMHGRLLQTLAIDDINVCYLVEDDQCGCRKPKPGKLLEAAGQWGIDLERSFMVGDRWRDVEAGKGAGCRTILIDGGYAERQAKDPDAVVHSLPEASALILSQQV